jgi:uncharacterized protein YueI
MKILFIVSNTAQIEMFRPIIYELKNYDMKIVNTGILFKSKIESLLSNYGFDYETMDKFNSHAVNKILDKENPNVIVTGNDQIFMDILFIKSANCMEIPSITVQDGVLFFSEEKDSSITKKLNYFLRIPFKFIRLFLKERIPIMYLIEYFFFPIRYSKTYSFKYGHGESTKIALFGEFTYKKLINEGIPQNKLEITGNSKFDKLIEYKNDKLKKKLKNKYNIPENETIILLVTQQFVEHGKWTQSQRYEFVSEIVHAVTTLNNAKLIIKIRYPDENKSDYTQILDNFSIPYKIFSQEPIEEVLCISDIVISSSSTAILEAMILKKKTMIVNLFHEDAPTFYKNSGAAYVEKTNEISKNLIKLVNHSGILNKKEVDQFICQQAYKVDGNSSKRILKLITDVSRP